MGIIMTRTLKFIPNIFVDIIELRRKISVTLYSIKRCLRGECPEYVNGPLVSVCIPTKNEAKFLPQLIYSLNHINIYKNIEIIVADYKSTDGTPKIARVLGAKVLELDRPGTGYARHICSIEARGEIIIQVDADTVITPYAIAKAVEKLTGSNLAKVYHVGHLYYDGKFIENFAGHIYDKYIRKPWKTPGYFIAYTRDLYERVQFDVNAGLGADDYKFGYDVYRKLGDHAFYLDIDTVIMISKRRLVREGYINYYINNFKGLLG